MRISVVIGTRNRAPLLRITLEHLRGQDYAPGDEVIVVDNASSDDTRDVVIGAARHYPVPLTYLREDRLGKSAAVNRGVGEARGDVLALTDDDVMAAPDWIATIRRVFSSGAVDLAGGRVDPWWEAEPPWWLRWRRAESSAMLSPLALLHYGEAQPLGDRTAVGANLVMRRTVYQQLGGFNPELGRQQGTLLCGEDHDFCARAVRAWRCEYRPEIRVRHWVPADRLRVRYYLRWFCWSGITNARLDALARGREAPGAPGRSLAVYMGRRIAVQSLRAIGCALTARPAAAVEHMMEAAFAFGYLRESIAPAAASRPAGTAAATQTAGTRVA
jgi:glycosyltransferase involved in cell wall biosynthesis